MSKPHVHAELIKAWADGAEVQVYLAHSWVDSRVPAWVEDGKYRIKPDPFAEFKEALARGERVDARLKGLPPGVGWFELRPDNKTWRCNGEYRVAKPWQDERDAYDRGETIETRGRLFEDWVPGWTTLSSDMPPVWAPRQQYRVKPKAITETFAVGALMQWSPEPHDGITARPSPFNIPAIALDITYAEGKVTNVKVKEWKA